MKSWLLQIIAWVIFHPLLDRISPRTWSQFIRCAWWSALSHEAFLLRMWYVIILNGHLKMFAILTTFLNPRRYMRSHSYKKSKSQTKQLLNESYTICEIHQTRSKFPWEHVRVGNRHPESEVLAGFPGAGVRRTVFTISGDCWTVNRRSGMESAPGPCLQIRER